MLFIVRCERRDSDRGSRDEPLNHRLIVFDWGCKVANAAKDTKN